MTLTAGVLFSGIGGWDIGAERAGVNILWGCEVDKFCTKVLTKRWPDAPVYPDVRTFDPKEVAPVDILIASPPCQDLSVAGKRAGLVGARSGLFFDFVRIAAALRPGWLLMEQVPGLVSSHKGEDFQQVVEAITELGYGLSWRCLDSRHLGVPQRRRRLYFVGRLGEPCPFEVLFEPAGGVGDPAARGAQGAEAPRTVGDGVAGPLGGHHPRGDLDSHGAYVPEAAYAVTARDYKGVSQREGVTTLVAEEASKALRAAGSSSHAEDHETYAFYSHTGVDQKQEDIAPPITEVYPPSVMPTLREHTRPTSNGDGGVIAFAWQQGDDSKFNKSGRGRSWLVRAGDYAGSVQAQRVDAVSIPAETAHTLKAEGADASEDGTGRGVPIVLDNGQGDPNFNDKGEAFAVNTQSHQSVLVEPELAHTLTAPDTNAAPVDGKRQDGSRTDRIPIVFSIMPMNSNTDYKAREVPVTQPLLGGPGRNQGGDLVVAAPLTHGSFDKSHTPGRRMEDDVNLVVMRNGGDVQVREDAGNLRDGHMTGMPVIYRKSKRAQTETDDETWVPDDSANTLNAFDVGDARATELITGPVVAVRTSETSSNGWGVKEGETHTLDGAQTDAIAPPQEARAGIVRRLTVTECERLQAFPDGWTCLEVDWVTHPDIGWPYLGFPDGTPYSTEECSCPDGPRYRALGNAVTTNAAAWVVGRLVRWIEFDRGASQIAKWVVGEMIPDFIKEQTV